MVDLGCPISRVTALRFAAPTLQAVAIAFSAPLVIKCTLSDISSNRTLITQ